MRGLIILTFNITLVRRQIEEMMRGQVAISYLSLLLLLILLLLILLLLLLLLLSSSLLFFLLLLSLLLLLPSLLLLNITALFILQNYHSHFQVQLLLSKINF